jgi:hypothetical protein
LALARDHRTERSAQRLECRVNPLGRPFDAQFDVTARQPPVATVSQRRQAEGAHRRKVLLDLQHDRHDRRFGRAEDQQRALGNRFRIEMRGVFRIEHGFQHRPGHRRKTREEMVAIHRESRNTVERIRNDAGALWEFAHRQTLAVFVRSHVGLAKLGATRRDQCGGLGMKRELACQRRRRSLARVVVRSRADTPTAEHHVRSGETAAQRFGQQGPFVRQVLGPAQTQAARRQQVDDALQMPVRTLARENLVTDHEQTETQRHRAPPDPPVWRQV